MKTEASQDQVLDKTSRKSAVMLAKMLVFAMVDFEDLGMPDWSLKLEQGINEIMAKYEIRPEDLRVSRREVLQ
jgi:hypothetical protein